MNDHIRAMNEKFNKRFRNNSNNNYSHIQSYTQSYTQSHTQSHTQNPIYYNSTNPDSSRIVFDSGASWAVQLNEGYSVIHVNNISRNFCANHCK